jgi:hypothetical protein
MGNSLLVREREEISGSLAREVFENSTGSFVRK